MTVPVIFNYLTAMNERRATDLYLTVGVQPMVRVEDQLVAVSDTIIDEAAINDILAALLSTRQRRDFDTKMELNTSLDMGKHGRYRINVLRQRQNAALVIRRIISKIPTFAELRLPQTLEALSLTRRGLILLTGMTGSGKSTTLASMVDYRNRTETGHIITIEDPIEYFHEHNKCIITQREVGVDTDSYAIALKNALRQRPDVILVGEIRDREVMEQALSASETGHLCLATLHTNNASQAIERITNMFPEDYHTQIRMNLAANLRAIISQRLIARKGGGLTLALEVLLNEGLIKDLIHEGKITKIKEVMEQNSIIGMCSFDQSLFDLYKADMITEETAITEADIPADMKMRIQQHRHSGSKEGLGGMDTSKLKLS